MTLVWRPGFQFDDDASTYIEAVEAADTQTLEANTRYAINDFVIGCKSDGIWPAIKASCILAGARTLTGALVPLIGAAPTNGGGLFVSGDYNRKTGLVGNGSTKYLDSNRNNNADPQNSRHVSIFFSSWGTVVGSEQAFNSGGVGVNGRSFLSRSGTSSDMLARLSADTQLTITSSFAAGLYGLNRDSSSTLSYRLAGLTGSGSQTSSSPNNRNIHFLGNDALGGTDGRVAFYSIGESLNLAALDNRISILIAQFAAVIP
jgi:hypothetical protein